MPPSLHGGDDADCQNEARQSAKQDIGGEVALHRGADEGLGFRV